MYCNTSMHAPSLACSVIPLMGAYNGCVYRIAGIFRRCKFSYELPSLIFRTLNFRTGLNAYVLPLVLPIAHL